MVKRNIYHLVMFMAAFGLSVPAHGQELTLSFFSASEKYELWFREVGKPIVPSKTMVLGRITITHNVHPPTSLTYPYPDKKFSMTERMWEQAIRKIESGKPDWFDVEIVRQRAEMERFPPAMNFLGWMYEKDRGLKRNFRNAFFWYAQAELAGVTNLRGNPIKLFKRMRPGNERKLALLNISDAFNRIEKGGDKYSEGFHQIDKENLLMHYSKSAARR